MTCAIVAFHYPRAEYRDEMIARVNEAATIMAQTPGCIEALCWLEESAGAVVATGKWESRDAWTASLQAVAAAGIDFDEDEREYQPRDVFLLTEPG